MNYIEIDHSKVDGYDKMSRKAKEIFNAVYKKHNSSIGMDSKGQWVPTKVKEHSSLLKVHFNNREWLHYSYNYTWY
ncbi:hypothetical protein [Sporosalibacterium faouarense]|uniref:hypothetical protein n=1 Tax=Sporosalibacterium faouarense TaxID=516123 RepID=UPI00192A6FBF|nr:hypothetical protein [Sporosalibacterium faouarense]